jgi:hypothetical protein
MAGNELLATTGNQRIDQILQGVVGVFEATFPGRVRGYFLLGSYVDRSAVPASDVDVGILFKDAYCDDVEAERALRLCQDCEANSAVLLEMWAMSEEQLRRADRFGIALQVALGSQLLYGGSSPVASEVRPDARYVRWAMHVPLYGLVALRGQPAALTYPLDFPDQSGPFYGYDRLRLAGTGDVEQPGTKLLVAIVGRIATALVALHTGHYVRSKQGSVAFYRAHIADQWADLVEQVYVHCRGDWDYHVPSAPAERQQLRLLCQRALAFENAFLLTYRDFLLNELQSTDEAPRLLALERLRQVIYPSLEVRAAVRNLTLSTDEQLRHAASATLHTIDTRTTTS